MQPLIPAAAIYRDEGKMLEARPFGVVPGKAGQMLAIAGGLEACSQGEDSAIWGLARRGLSH